MRLLFLLLFNCVSFSALHSQVTDSLFQVSDTSSIDSLISIQDTTIKKRNFVGRFLKDGYPDPKKAVLLSFVLPGGGQLYNKQYWKVPLAYATIGGAIFAIDFNGKRYRLYRDDFIARRDDVEGNENAQLAGLSDENVRSLRNQYRKNLELSSFGLIAAYIFNAADAFVSAHLKPFDVSDDLTLEFGPTLSNNPNELQTMGVGLKLKLKNKNSRFGTIAVSH